MAMRRAFVVLLIASFVAGPFAAAQTPDDNIERLQRMDVRQLEGLRVTELNLPDDDEDDVPVSSPEGVRDLLASGSSRVRVGVEDDGRARIQYIRDDASGVASVLVLTHPERGTIYATERTPGEAIDSMRFQLVRVVRFVDRDGDGLYTPNEDRLVQNTPFRRIEWDRARMDDSLTGNGGHAVEVVGEVPRDGRLLLRVEAAGSFVDPEGASFALDDLDVGFSTPAGQREERRTQTLLGVLVDVRQRGTIGGLAPTDPVPFDPGEARLLVDDQSRRPDVRLERYVVTAGPAGDAPVTLEQLARERGVEVPRRSVASSATLDPELAICSTMFIC